MECIVFSWSAKWICATAAESPTQSISQWFGKKINLMLWISRIFTIFILQIVMYFLSNEHDIWNERKWPENVKYKSFIFRWNFNVFNQSKCAKWWWREPFSVCKKKWINEFDPIPSKKIKICFVHWECWREFVLLKAMQMQMQWHTLCADERWAAIDIKWNWRCDTNETSEKQEYSGPTIDSHFCSSTSRSLANTKLMSDEASSREFQKWIRKTAARNSEIQREKKFVVKNIALLCLASMTTFTIALREFSLYR